MNIISYQVELIPENAKLIDKANALFIGAKVLKTTDTSSDDSDTSGDTLTLEDLKTAAKAAKKEHDADFVNAVLDDQGVKKLSALGKRLAAVDEDDYETIIDLLNRGPSTDADDDLGDDDDDLGDDDEAPSVDAVKTAVRAYAKMDGIGNDKAKKLMKKNGAEKLSEIGNCSEAQLTAIFKVATAE